MYSQKMFYDWLWCLTLLIIIPVPYDYLVLLGETKLQKKVFRSSVLILWECTKIMYTKFDLYFTNKNQWGDAQLLLDFLAGRPHEQGGESLPITHVKPGKEYSRSQT